MKKVLQYAACFLLLLAINHPLSTAHAQGTAFTYQGQLENNGSPASGTYDLSFTLFATNATGVPVAGPVTNNGVVVSNGLFTVPVDFGSGAFTGQSNWLEIAVATNLTTSFTTLAPRQAVTPAPYAIYAETASNVSGTLPASQLAGDANGNLFVGPSGNSTTTGSGNSATGESALKYNTTGNNNTANGNETLVANKTGSDNTASGYDALGVNQFGSYNTAVGYQALNNNATGSNNIALGYQAGMNIYTASSNIDIGNAGTFTDNNVIRIGSGQSQAYLAGVINGNGGGLTNVTASGLVTGAAIGAGAGNSFPPPLYSQNPFIGGGQGNTIGTATNTFIGAGSDNINNTTDGGIVGGQNNLINIDSDDSFMGGGQGNAIKSYADHGVVVGGLDNQLSPGTAAPGFSSDCFIGGGANNSISSSGSSPMSYSVIGGGSYNQTAAEWTTIGGGSGNSISPTSQYAFIGGGSGNSVVGNSGSCVVAGGYDNSVSGQFATVSGGHQNTNNGIATAIGGGYLNQATGSYATVPGGEKNIAYGPYSLAAGQQAQALHQGAFVWADSQNALFSSTANDQFNVRAGGGVQFVTGGTGMTVDGLLMTSTNLQANGNLNLTSGSAMDLKSATTMQVESSTTTVKGLVGVNIQCSGNSLDFSPGIVTLTGSLLQFQGPAIMNSMLTVDGLTTFAEELTAYGGVGIGTSSPEQALSVVGGMNVDAGNANNGPVGSGGFNQGGPTNGCLTFGTSSTGTGFSGEGIQSKRTSGGTQYDLEFFTGFNKQMVILNNGNVGIASATPGALLQVGSATCNGTTWSSGSDRNSKEDFVAIKPGEVLAKVAALPITEWKYKVEASGTEHLGPMAQDFHEAFGLNGADDKHITMVDEGGVALAAIQGLNQKVEEQQAELSRKETEVTELKQRLAALEKIVLKSN